jgi:phage recombination protein Bet
MKNNTNNELIQFKEEQIELIKRQIAPGANDNELKLFLYQAQRTGLDPLTRQIYCIHRGGKMTIQTSIDGFRVIAERSGEYAGQDEPIYTEENGKLISCKITVYKFRGDVRYPASVGVAYLSEYAQTTPIWNKMPRVMLAKVAEALALRKAFPQDLSGLYTSDEIADAQIKDISKDIILEPEGQMKNLSNIVSDELRVGAEQQRLNKLKEALSKMQSTQEIDDYLAKKFQGKSRREVLSSMSEENAKKAMDMIKNARDDLWIDQEENEVDIEEESNEYLNKLEGKYNV